MHRAFLGLVRNVSAALLLFLCLTGTSRAQYMYMDTNGDGIWTSADRMQPNGTPTTVSVWVNTNHNKNGSLATCDSPSFFGDLGTWNSYAVNIGAIGGTVAFSGVTNQLATFTIPSTPFGADASEMKYGQATGIPEAGGLKRMFTVVVTGASGTPALSFLPYGNLGPDPTSFGTPCVGYDFDNTYKLGSDWFDADGLGAIIVDDPNNPVITTPALVEGTVASPVSVTATATDPDAGQLVTLSQANNAPFLSGPASVGPTTTPSITLSGTPNSTQAGNYTIHWSASDNVMPTPGTSVATTTVRVKAIDLPPTVTVPATVAVWEGSPLSLVAVATDPNGDAIGNLTAAGTALAAGATFTKNSSNSAGTLSWTPTYTQAGSYGVTFTATNTLTGSASTAITVTDAFPSDRAPVVSAPATRATVAGTPVTFSVSASDPDGDPILSLTASGSAITGGGAFATDASNSSGTFTWTPTSAQVGGYGATFTATNSLSGLATTAISVTSANRPVAVSGPVTASGFRGQLIWFEVTAEDPDADPIASLTASGPAISAGGTFTTNSTNTSGTFNWVPGTSLLGNYTVTFTATQPSSSASLITTITVMDRAPVVSAPGTAAIVAGSVLTFQVFATDPDGEGIGTLTATGPAFTAGATFTKNSSNTAGTVNWTPSLSQAGTYNATFTAANALSRAATTTITVLASVPRPYMYMDTNGDGAFTAADRLQPNGTPTIVDVWVNTSHDTNGSPAACDTGDGDLATWNSYAVIIGATGGTVSFGTPTNQVPTFTIPTTPFGATGTEMKFGQASGTPEAGGLKRMFTVTVTGSTGSPALAFLPYGVLGPDPTSFGTSCSGLDFDNTYKLGADWFDAFGAARFLADGHADPSVAVPAAVHGTVNTVVSVTASASDPDAGQLVTLSQTNNAPFLTGAASAGPVTTPSLTLTGTPTSAQAGSYTVTWSAVDDATPTPGTATATTVITIGSAVAHAPVVTAPVSVAGTVNSPLSVAITAADPDGDAITTLTASGTAVVAGGVFTGNAANTSGTMDWTPTSAQVGNFSVTFTASNILSGSATTAITVSAPGVTNLVGNPSFELSGAGWAGLDGGIIDRADGGFEGNYCLEIQGPAIGTGKFSVNDSPNWVVRVPAAGTVYRFTAWVRSASSKGRAQLRVREYLAKVHQGTSYSRPVVLTPAWQLVTLDCAAIAAGSTLDLQVMDAPVAAGEVFQTDAISIVVVSGGAAVVAAGDAEMAPVVAPNPLNPDGMLAYSTSNAGPVQVRIFDASGRFVRTLVEEPAMEPGRHAVRFDGNDAGGRRLASGIYFYRIEADRRAKTGRFTILK